MDDQQTPDTLPFGAENQSPDTLPFGAEAHPAAQGKVSAVAPTNHIPPSNTVMDALRGAYQNSLGPLLHSLSPTNLMGSADRLPGSVAQGEEIPKQAKEAKDNATKTFADPKASNADKFDSIAYMVPGVGPQLKHLDDLAKQGNHAEAYGGAAGVIASLLGPKILSGVAPTVADAMDAGAAKVSPNVSGMMNKYIGLQPSDLAKYEKFNPGAPEEIGNAVYEHAGLKNNLKAQHQAITDAIAGKQQEQSGIVNNASSQPIDIQHLLFDKAGSLQDELRNAEGETPRVGAVGNNWEALHKQYGNPAANVNDAVQMRNNLRGRITDWNPKTQNVEQRYLQDVYHGLNDQVANSLNPTDQITWRNNNRAMNRLIIAKDAAGQKLTGQAMQFEGPIKTAAKVGKIAQPAKWAENVPESMDRTAAMAPSATLRAGSGVARLAGESNLNRVLHAPLLPKDDKDASKQ